MIHHGGHPIAPFEQGASMVAPARTATRTRTTTSTPDATRTLVLASAAALALVVFQGCGESGERPAASLVGVSGPVEIARAKEAPAAVDPARLPLALTDGTTIETGKGATASLKLLTGTDVSVRENSRYTIDVFAKSRKDPAVHDLSSTLKGKDGALGAAFFSVTKDKAPAAPKFGRFEVKAGSVVTAVMGTEFAVEEQGGTVRVFRGEGAVQLFREEDDTGGPPEWARALGYTSRRGAMTALDVLRDATKSAIQIDIAWVITVLNVNQIVSVQDFMRWRGEKSYQRAQ
jgi:hypothetical protein